MPRLRAPGPDSPCSRPLSSFGPRYQHKERGGLWKKGRVEPHPREGVRAFLVQVAALLLWEEEPHVCKLLGLAASCPLPTGALSRGPLAAPGLGTQASVRVDPLPSQLAGLRPEGPDLWGGSTLHGRKHSKHRTLKPKAPLGSLVPASQVGKMRLREPQSKARGLCIPKDMVLLGQHLPKEGSPGL